LQAGSVDTALGADDASLSAEISQLTARLRDAGQLHQQPQQHSDTATGPAQDVSSDLIRTSLSVLKLEKQTRLQKVALVNVSLLHRLDFLSVPLLQRRMGQIMKSLASVCQCVSHHSVSVVAPTAAVFIFMSP